MNQYEAIQKHIDDARIQRSVYLAQLISEDIAAAWNGVKSVADVLFSVARAKSPKGVFTFDA